MKPFFAIMLLLCFVTRGLQGQDLHFSQFFNNPLLTNPANTGFIPDADYRLGASYRNQYSSILADPYNTFSIYGDAQVLRNRIENGWVGLGGVVIRDVAGAGRLTSTKAYASVAYHQMLGLSSLLTAGFNIGWADKRLDPTKLTFPDQFDGRFFSTDIPTTVVLEHSSINYFDVQAGMNYAYFPTANTFINAGYSIHHVNNPKETFFADDGSGSNRIHMRHIGFISGIFRVAENVIISPNAYYTRQSSASELVLGLTGAYNLTERGEKQFIAGLYYRYQDAFIPMAGFEVNDLRFTFSYDMTQSTLKNFNQMRGALEFNVIKKGFYEEYFGNRQQTLCPTF